MNNRELAEAIAAAFHMSKNVVSARFEQFNEHLNELLEIQRDRARESLTCGETGKELVSPKESAK